MEVCEQPQILKIEEAADLSFSPAKIILREGDKYYHAITSDCYIDSTKVDLYELDLLPIPVSQLCPPFSTQFRRAPDSLHHGCYVKGHILIYYSHLEGPTALGSLIVNQAEIRRILRASLHPNIG